MVSRTDANSTANTLLALAASLECNHAAPSDILNATVATNPIGGIAMEETISSSITLANDVWHHRIQDKDVSKDELDKKNKTYKQYRITPVGSEGEELFYYGLSCIAIDVVKHIYPQKEMGLGWRHLPVNKTNAKRNHNKDIGIKKIG